MRKNLDIQQVILKQWCVEQALKVNELDENGQLIQPDVIKTAEKIYNWVKK